jgi:hypothetical protein
MPTEDTEGSAYLLNELESKKRSLAFAEKRSNEDLAQRLRSEINDFEKRRIPGAVIRAAWMKRHGVSPKQTDSCPCVTGRSHQARCYNQTRSLRRECIARRLSHWLDHARYFCRDRKVAISVSQPYGYKPESVVTFCEANGLACFTTPEGEKASPQSWYYPGGTSLLVFVPSHEADEYQKREGEQAILLCSFELPPQTPK